MMQDVDISLLRLSQQWCPSRPLEHAGDPAGAVGATISQGMQHHPASTGFIILLTATAPVPENNLNILGECPNTALLSPWEGRASRLGAEPLCLTGVLLQLIWPEACLSAQHTHLAALESETNERFAGE